MSERNYSPMLVPADIYMERVDILQQGRVSPFTRIVGINSERFGISPPDLDLNPQPWNLKLSSDLLSDLHPIIEAQATGTDPQAIQNINRTAHLFYDHDYRQDTLAADDAINLPGNARFLEPGMYSFGTAIEQHQLMGIVGVSLGQKGVKAIYHAPSELKPNNASKYIIALGNSIMKNSLLRLDTFNLYKVLYGLDSTQADLYITKLPPTPSGE